MRILALTRYGQLGSSSRVRFYQYFPYLQSHGLELHGAGLLDDEYVRRLYGQRPNAHSSIALAYLRRIQWLTHSRSFDLLWIEKELFPWLPPLVEQLLSLLRIPYVVDYDDATFHRYDLHPSSLVRLTLGKKVDAVMRHARLVIAGNPYLAERARRAGAREVACLPSVVDLNRYQPKEDHPGSIFRIGWIGSPITAPFLAVARRPLEIFCREKDVQLVLIGAGDHDPLPGIPKENLAWNEADEAGMLRNLDSGIMPLPDGLFERGKCGYKLIQYMAAGLPVIASPVGVNTEIVENSRTGFMASSDEEWISALEFLRLHPRERAEMGRAGRKKAEAQYDIAVTAPKLLHLLHSALEDHG